MSGSQVYLSCEVVGVPTPVLTWKKVSLCAIIQQLVTHLRCILFFSIKRNTQRFRRDSTEVFAFLFAADFLFPAAANRNNQSSPPGNIKQEIILI